MVQGGIRNKSERNNYPLHGIPFRLIPSHMTSSADGITLVSLPYQSHVQAQTISWQIWKPFSPHHGARGAQQNLWRVKRPDKTGESEKVEARICSVALSQRSSDPFRGFISLSGDAHEGRYITDHVVMKDYLRQKRKSSKPGDMSPAASKLSDHLIQYRLPLRGK